MDNIKLIPLIPGKKFRKAAAREWILQKDRVYSIGRSVKTEKVDIDIFFDKSLAGREADLFYQAGKWYAREAGRSCCSLNGKKFTSKQVLPVREYDRITIGRWLELLVVPACREIIYWKDICIIIRLTDILNYALLYCGISPVREITLYNCAAAPSRPFTIELAIEPYYRKEYIIPSLKRRLSFSLADFGIYPELFPEQAVRLLCSIRTGKSVLFQKTVRWMSFNTWLKTEDSFACTSLASFVLPEHTYVVRISEKIRACRKEQETETVGAEKSSFFCGSLYEYLKDQWHITFREEQAGTEFNAQVVRLPHHILYDWENKTGEGNCLDLSLLIASCLENLQLPPVLIILEMGKSLWHCLVGYRKADFTDTGPLIRNKAGMHRSTLFFDPNGLTSGLSFACAVEKGRELFDNYPLLFGLDIKTAREYDIRSLPFEALPRESPVVIQLAVRAKKLAETLHAEYKVCTSVHMLIALLENRGGLVNNLFRGLGLDVQKAVLQLCEGLRNIHTDKKIIKLAFSGNYQLLLSRAMSIAREKKSLFILEEHLFLALLELRGSSLDRALRDLGVDKETLRAQVSILLQNDPAGAAEIKSFYNNKEEKLFFF